MTLNNNKGECREKERERGKVRESRRKRNGGPYNSFLPSLLLLLLPPKAPPPPPPRAQGNELGTIYGHRGPGQQTVAVTQRGREGGPVRPGPAEAAVALQLSFLLQSWQGSAHTE